MSRALSNHRELTQPGVAVQLRDDASRDPLTGLDNRSRFEKRLRQALGRREAVVAVLFVDLDNFKTVNDSLGHAAGDRLLGEAGRRIARCIRSCDTLARMGGDEFSVLLAGSGASTRAPRIAQRILRALGSPLELEGRIVIPPASIGIAMGRGGDSAQELLRNADLALSAAKHAGKGQVSLYEPSMHTAALQRLELETDLRLALQRDELVLHYQPLFRLTDGELVGYEALARWQHPARGLLAPGTFIEPAEQTGLIVPLTRWALRTACQQTAAWQRQSTHALDVAVNLSSVNLEDRRIVSDVAAALHVSGISSRSLVLEITESTVMRDHDTTQQILHELKRLGVRITIDDFGTGHSSLSRLSRLPFDTLKIPRPFIERITDRQTDLAVAQGIVDLAHRLNLEVVAEGIETSMQLAHVREIGCEVGQGYHLATPASAGSTNPDRDRFRHRTLRHGLTHATTNRPSLALVRDDCGVSLGS